MLYLNMNGTCEWDNGRAGLATSSSAPGDAVQEVS